MKKALGRGLDALLPAVEDENRSFVVQIPILKIEPNPEQPRQHFDDSLLEELAASIKDDGAFRPVNTSSTVFGLFSINWSTPC